MWLQLISESSFSLTYDHYTIVGIVSRFVIYVALPSVNRIAATWSVDRWTVLTPDANRSQSNSEQVSFLPVVDAWGGQKGMGRARRRKPATITTRADASALVMGCRWHQWVVLTRHWNAGQRRTVYPTTSERLIYLLHPGHWTAWQRQRRLSRGRRGCKEVWEEEEIEEKTVEGKRIRYIGSIQFPLFSLSRLVDHEREVRKVRTSRRFSVSERTTALSTSIESEPAASKTAPATKGNRNRCHGCNR